MRRILAVRTRVKGRDDGVSLTELLISMGVFSVVMAAVLAVFVNTIDSVRFVSTKTSTTADARIAMEALTRTIRVAVIPKGEPAALVDAQDGQVAFYSSLNRGAAQSPARPTLVTYRYDPTTSCLLETQVAATTLVPANPAQPFEWPGLGTTRCLIKTSAAPLFEYFDDGRITGDDGSEVQPLATPSGALPSASLGAVISIQISLSVQAPGAVDVQGTQVRDRVTLANVQSALNLGG